MSNKHDHKSKGGPRTSPSMNIAGRPSVIAHGDEKSVHTHRSPGRNDPQNVALAADREIGEGHAGGAPGSTNPSTGWVPPATGNPAFAPDAGVQAALFYERQNNAAGRPPLK